MSSITINFVSPHGTPIALTVDGQGDDTDQIKALTDRADAIGQYYHALGWAFAETTATRPGAAELAAGPTFAGYPCSPTVSENGLPTWLIVDGKQAQRREKQGDVWYSVKLQDGSYDQVLRIPKGETAPPVMGLSQ